MTDPTQTQIDWVWLILLVTTLTFGVMGACLREKTTKLLVWVSIFIQVLWLSWTGYSFGIGEIEKPLIHFDWIYAWNADLTLNKLWILVGLVVISILTHLNTLFSKSSDVVPSNPTYGQVKTTLLILSGLILGVVATTPWPALFGLVFTSLGIVLCLNEGIFSNHTARLSKSWFVFWAIGILLLSVGIVFEQMGAEEVGRLALLFGTVTLFMNVPTPLSTSASSFSRYWIQFSYWVSIYLLGLTLHSVWQKAFVSFQIDLFLISTILVLGFAVIRWTRLESGFAFAFGLFGLWNHLITHSLENGFFANAVPASLTLAYGLMISTLFPLWLKCTLLVVVSFASFIFWNENHSVSYAFWEGIYQTVPVNQALFYISITLVTFIFWLAVLSGKKRNQSKVDFVHPAFFLALLLLQFHWNGQWEVSETARSTSLCIGLIIAILVSRNAFLTTPPEMKWVSSFVKKVEKVHLFFNGWLGESYELLIVKFSRVIENSIIRPISSFLSEKVSMWTENAMQMVEGLVEKILQGVRIWKVTSTRTHVLISWLITLLISLIVILE